MVGLPTPKSTASFWHSEPSDLLLGHRTTPDLPAKADIVIIGSGLTGASVARHLAEDARAKDLSVVMLDAREACWGATGRNGGHCQPLLFDSTPDVAEFEIRNVNALRTYIAKHDVPCEWRSAPACRTFWTEALAETAERNVEELKSHAPELGSQITVVKDKVDLRKHKVEEASLATLTASANSLWPYKLISFVLEKLVRDGNLNLQTNTPVTKLHMSQSQSFPRVRMETSRGDIDANHVILATEAYTSYLLPEFSDLIVSERLIMSALLPPDGMERLPNSYGFVGAMGANAKHDDYLIQRPFTGVPNPAGHLMFGGGRVASTLDNIDVTDDSIVDQGSVKYLQEALLKLMTLDGTTTDLHELKATHAWSGCSGTSKDLHPWVGAVPDRPGVWLSAGYSGHGMPNGTLCGKAVVEMLLGEESQAPYEYVAERLVKTGQLPAAYVITPERMERAKGLESVRRQDEMMTGA